MFTHIMVPVDLAEKETLTRAIEVAADLAGHYQAPITLVSVIGGLQAKVSHSAAEYGRQLASFGDEIAAAHGVEIDTITYDVPDPSVEVDQKLIEAITAHGIDLAVVGSHQPGWPEYFVNSHGGKLARHAPISVFVVRDGSD